MAYIKSNVSQRKTDAGSFVAVLKYKHLFKPIEMWSNQYYYLNICKDNLLSEETSTIELLDFISEIPELEIIKEFEFKNKSPFPFTKILLLRAKSLNSWSEKDSDINKTNLISIVCSKEDADFIELKRVFVKIAKHLEWSLIDEETGCGIENYIIWSPELE